MLRSLTLKRILLEIGGVLLVSALIGWVSGAFFFVLFLGMLGLALWHYLQLRKLSHWLWEENRLFPPDGRGTWLPIFHGLHRMRKKQREERNRLAERVSYLRRGAEAIPDAVMLCDAKGRLEWCNHQAETLLGLRWPQDQEQLLTNLIRYPEFSNYLKLRQFEMPLKLTVDGHLHIEFRFVYPYIEYNLLIIARNITETAKLEQMRQNFFANVNHELRVPLTVIKGYLEMLDDMGGHSSFEEKAILHMSSQADRLYALVQQLMKLSKIESATERDKIGINLSQMGETLIHECPHHEEYPITSHIVPNLWIEGDLEEIKQVATNLFYNAILHNEVGTPIHLAVEPEGEYEVRFSVTDSGRGIDEAHLAHLTERFYRVSESRKRDAKNDGGSGLGLAIVKHALQNHGSELEVESTLGRGSTFSFVMKSIDPPAISKKETR